MSQGSALNTWEKEVTIDQDGEGYGRGRCLGEISSSILNIVNGCWLMVNIQVWKTGEKCPLAEMNFPRVETFRM